MTPLPCTTHRPLNFLSGSPSSNSLPFSQRIGKIRAKCTFLLSLSASLITSRFSLTLVTSQTPCYNSFSPSSKNGLLCLRIMFCRDCFSVQLSKVPGLARFDTPVYFKLTILPCLVYDFGERPSVALGPLRTFTSAWLMIRVFYLTRT